MTVMPRSKPPATQMDDELKYEIAALRALIDSNDRRYQVQADSEAEARLIASAALNKRLDGMNEFRAAMSDQGTRMMPRAEFESFRDIVITRIDQFRPGIAERVQTLSEQMTQVIPRREFDEAKVALNDKIETYRSARDARTENELAPMRTAIADAKKPNWPFLASGLSGLIAIVAGIWLVIGLKIESVQAPLQLGLEQTKVSLTSNIERVRTLEVSASASTQADGTSKIDRAQLNDRVRTIESALPNATAIGTDIGNLKQNYGLIVDRQAGLRADVVQQAAALIEIETQFCASDIVRNLMHAEDVRKLSMLWQKEFQVQFPTDNTYYPVVCNRPSGHK